MTNLDIAHRRLHNQLITHPTFDKPGDIVRWLVAIQAQDYPGALWAVGLRMRDATETAIEQAIAERTIVRTWPMRGTLHFVAPEDARWMLQLLTPRIIAGNARRLYHQSNLDDATFARSKDLFVSALRGDRQLPRNSSVAATFAQGCEHSPDR